MMDPIRLHPLDGPADLAATTHRRSPLPLQVPIPVPGVLDATALAELAQLDPTGANNLLQRVLVTYRSSSARLLGQIVAARQPLDLPTIKIASHTLKSSTASVGALWLSALCAMAEIAVRDGRHDVLPAILDDLLLEAACIDVAVHQLLLPQ